MKEFKGELALLCLQRGVSLQELQEIVTSMANNSDCKINKRGMKYICTLDGYDYFLGEYLKEGVSWHEALKYAESLGSGWEVPSKEVLKQMYLKMEVLGIKGVEWLWSGEGYSATSAWDLYFGDGQFGNSKTGPALRSVRPVYVTDSFEW